MSCRALSGSCSLKLAAAGVCKALSAMTKQAYFTRQHKRARQWQGGELFSKFVGESERAVAALFARARATAPCVVFFDEIDGLASDRGSDDSSGGCACRWPFLRACVRVFVCVCACARVCW